MLPDSHAPPSTLAGHLAYFLLKLQQACLRMIIFSLKHASNCALHSCTKPGTAYHSNTLARRHTGEVSSTQRALFLILLGHRTTFAFV